MCSGDITELSCGHVLAHVTAQCSRARETGRACARPTGGARAQLADTCATCDPAFITSSIGRSYRKRQAELAALLTAALQARRADDVGRVHDEMESLRQRTNSAIGEAVRQRRMVSPRATGMKTAAGAGDVEFPGGSPSLRGDRVPGYTSSWVGGKCVWEREMPITMVPHRRRGSEASKTVTKAQGLEFLNKKLDEARRQQRIARGEEVEGDAADGKAKDGEKPLWYRKFGPVQSPRVVEAALPRPSHTQNKSARPVVQVAEQLPPHPLRHKKKVASWLPTEEEMDELAARLSTEASLEPEEGAGEARRRRPSRHLPRGGEHRQGESSEKKLPHPRQQRAGESGSRAASPAAGQSVRHHRPTTSRNESYAARFRDAQATAQQQHAVDDTDADGEEIDIWLYEAERTKR
ncbi:hypothetical protein SLS62_007709 [Diatrype stigma]|uniref:Uncharacterized protein n=1 Tax=Diatrype stigma TaxID=117547 RepID=A0AAN9YQ03_9PEZI